MPEFIHPETTAWLEHTPFASWIIDALRPRCFVELGTHHAVSYFAFCQAIRDTGTATKAFAVDTWVGDEHAGYYGEEVYRRVSDINEANFGAFSKLIRSTFDEAVSSFAPGTIDLLHIDGLHTYEAVRHDFEPGSPYCPGTPSHCCMIRLQGNVISGCGVSRGAAT